MDQDYQEQNRAYASIEKGDSGRKDISLELCCKESKDGWPCRKMKMFELGRHQNTVGCQLCMSRLDYRDPKFVSIIVTAVIPEKGYFKVRFQNLIVLRDKTSLFTAINDNPSEDPGII